MSLFEYETEIKISFEDLDPMCVVWYGNYMKYMEKARCEMLSKLNYTYLDMKKDNYIYPIAKMKVKYIKSAEFEDVLKIKTELLTIEPSMNIKYSIFNKKTNEKIFEGETMQIGVNPLTKETVYDAPKGLKDAVEAVK